MHNPTIPPSAAEKNILKMMKFTMYSDGEKSSNANCISYDSIDTILPIKSMIAKFSCFL